MSLTRAIHADLQSKGLMAVPPKPTRDQLLGRAKLPNRGRQRMPWEAPFDKQPRDYAVTALIPHCATPRLLKLCVGFLLRQTVPIYVLIVDTGTVEADLPEVLALRGERVEVHQVNCHGTDHAVANANYAMELGTFLCRTEYLWCVHSDCFVTRRDFLARLLAMADGGKNPCIGYQTIPKPQSPGFDSSNMVSHTCTLLHVPTLDDLDVTWSMRRLQRQAAKAARQVELDTEMALNYRLLDRGVKPVVLGPEQLDEIEIDANRVHLRAATAQSMYLGRTRDNSEIVGRLEKLLADDGDGLPGQLTTSMLFPLERTLFPPAAVRWALDKTVQRAAPKQFKRPTRLNLIYHITPFADNDVWRWNVRQMLERIEAFNGRRTAAIVTGDGMVDPAEVLDEFEEWPVDFLEFENSKTLREAVSWIELLKSVESTDPNEATFYAHARGVTRPKNPATHAWTTCMYRHLLDDVPAIQDLLACHPATGVSFRFVDQGFLYPGTFFWFRNDAVFNQERWDQLDGRFLPKVGIGWAVEAFPNHYLRDGARIYPALKYEASRSSDLYEPKFWERQVGVEEELVPPCLGDLASVHERYAKQTDKGTLHSYVPFYEGLFAPYKFQMITLVEFGVLNGGSLRMWRDYFSVARIVGIDIEQPAELQAGVKFILGDACKLEPFDTDIVIDDGSHLLAEQIAAFERWWPHVRPGGHYIIEDIQSDDDAKAIQGIHQFTLIDFRGVKGRYDDVILWAVKS